MLTKFYRDLRANGGRTTDVEQALQSRLDRLRDILPTEALTDDDDEVSIATIDVLAEAGLLLDTVDMLHDAIGNYPPLDVLRAKLTEAKETLAADDYSQPPPRRPGRVVQTRV